MLYTMKRTNIFLPQPALDRLRKLADETGLTVAELVRRAIDEYLKKLK
jgi:predicted DNA-binding protein